MTDDGKTTIQVELKQREGGSLQNKLAEEFEEDVTAFIKRLFWTLTRQPLIEVVWSEECLQEGNEIDVSIRLKTRSIAEIFPYAVTLSWMWLLNCWSHTVPAFASFGIGVIVYDNSGEIIARIRRSDFQCYSTSKSEP